MTPTTSSIPSTDDAHGALVTFFVSLYGTDPDGYVTICHARPTPTLKAKAALRVEWVLAADPDAAADRALSLALTENVWFGVGLRREPLAGNRRGGAEDVVLLPGLWADVDVAHPVHAKAAHLPPTMEAARELVLSMGPKPSILVDTGHGCQAYWLFDGPVVMADQGTRDRFKALSKRWGETLKARAAERGYKVDSTFDIARILRVPYTINRKADPVPVRLMEVD